MQTGSIKWIGEQKFVASSPSGHMVAVDSDRESNHAPGPMELVLLALGAFITAWGGICMVTSAPFDNWWHSAYGLDVKILSPPHALLAVGIFAIEFGTLTLLAGRMNSAEGALRTLYRTLFLYVGGMMLVALTVMQMEVATRTEMHTVGFYMVLSITAPLVLARRMKRGKEDPRRIAERRGPRPQIPAPPVTQRRSATVPGRHRSAPSRA